MTTEPRPARRPLSRLSVRTRITAVIAILATLAMAGAGVLVYALESARIERQTNAQIDQEIAEFRQLQGGNDPDTAEPFTSVQELLNTFIARNVPDDDEILVGYAGADEEAIRTPNRNAERFLGEPVYQRAVDAQIETGGTTKLTTEEYGEVWVTVIPVRNQQTSGALVIVNFLRDEADEISRTMQTYTIVAVLSLGILVLLASTQSGRLLAPLRTLRETASDITTSDLSRRIPEQGNDDITALTRTFNGMLDRLESGFVGQRQFLDDAGHELKTPLTVLRGHLELLDGDDPAEVEETRALLLDEVDRMSRLVGDLILLAKSNRPDFIAPQPVDLARLTESLLTKARALGDRDWRLDGVGAGTLVADEQRLTQAILQLADNAVKHTGPGDTIAIGSSYSPVSASIWVRDTGAGVAVEDREVIFERFGRSTVPEGDEGFGLGLSIVTAIVRAQGGTVSLESPDDGGATFVITMPLQPPGVPPTDRRGGPPWPAS